MPFSSYRHRAVARARLRPAGGEAEVRPSHWSGPGERDINRSSDSPTERVSMTVTLTELERRCVDAGVKMTSQHRIILSVLEAAADHPSVDEVYRRATDHDTSIRIPPVYRPPRLFDK